MEVNDELINQLAHLARLEFDTESKEEIKKDLTRMLAFVEKLNEVDTDNVEPLIYMNDETNVLREDVSQITITQKEALLNAPKKDSDYFKVPKVIDKQ
jgi:aspartyl-tRNA(Asn)/glutamyl-tRNA(Gln) amidotransferase subunit C